MYRIMLVDDEVGILRALKRVLAGENYEVDVFSDQEQALARAKATKYDMIISDFRMPKMDGVALLSEFKKIQPDAVRIILSGYSDMDALIRAVNRAEIYRFISKPWHDFELKAVIKQALNHYRVEQENRRLAGIVRRQQARLNQQQEILKKLEAESPGISEVNWADDGSIIIDDDDV